MGEVDLLARQQRSDVDPLGDQLLVQAVELVERGKDLLFPVPLDNRGLEQTGRRVAVEFEQLGRAFTVIAEVEAAIVQGRRLVVPGLAD